MNQLDQIERNIDYFRSQKPEDIIRQAIEKRLRPNSPVELFLRITVSDYGHCNVELRDGFLSVGIRVDPRRLQMEDRERFFDALVYDLVTRYAIQAFIK